MRTPSWTYHPTADEGVKMAGPSRNGTIRMSLRIQVFRTVEFSDGLFVRWRDESVSGTLV
jgi:hypothetical protein